MDTKWDLYGTVSVNRTLLWVLPREEELGYLLPHFPSGSALSKADSWRSVQNAGLEFTEGVGRYDWHVDTDFFFALGSFLCEYMTNR